MPYLDGFSNRLKLTIPNDKIDSTLTDFPVMINLSNSSGLTGFDATPVFEELSTVDRKKIAITTVVSGTQCPIEIEYWDGVGEKATLWTKVPAVYSNVDTELYFYYDATASGNVLAGATDDAPTYVSSVSPASEGTYDTGSVYDGTVIKEAGVYKMWYTGFDGLNNRILYCSSLDGTTWSDFQLVVDYDSEGTSDTIGCTSPSVIKDEDTYIMWYNRQTASAATAVRCTSPDGTTWSGFQSTNVTLTDANLKALWRFESGELNTDTVSTNDLSGTVSSDTSDYKEGGGCAVFSGSQSLTITDASLTSGFPLKSGDTLKELSICCWVKPSASGAWKPIWCKSNYNWGDNCCHLSVNNGQVMVGWGFGSSNTDYSTGIYLSNNEWYHVSVIIHGTSPRSLYVRVYRASNEIVSTYNTTPGSDINARTHNFTVGKWNDTSIYWSGKIDGLVAFNKILSNSEIDSIRSTGAYVGLSLSPSVIKDGSVYKMWYSQVNSGDAEVHYCTSVSGVSWANFQSVVSLSSEGTYDTESTASPTVIKNDSLYEMWYTGFDDTNERIIYCTSSDGVTWSDFVMAVDYDLEGTYDTISVYSPMVVKDANTNLYELWYSGNNVTTNRILYSNSGYGDWESTASHVWDDNFVGVWHMSQDPSGGADCILDSTKYGGHGTPYGSMSSANLVDGVNGKALSFDGAANYIQGPKEPRFESVTGLTVYCSVYNRVNGYIVTYDGNSYGNWQLHPSDSNVSDGSSWTSPPNISTSYNSWQFVWATWSSLSTVTMNRGDGSEGSSAATTYTNLHGTDSEDRLFIGKRGWSVSPAYADAIIDEVRVSDVRRSDSWMRTTYHSNWDQLIVYEDESQVTNWLGDWAKRIKLTVDSSKVYSTLHDFPMLVTLVSGTGITNQDVTDVFNELSTTNSGTIDSYTKLVLPPVGDYSDSGHVMTTYGSPELHKSTTASGMLGSMKFDGTADYLQMSDSPDWDFGAEDFAIDLWFYRTSDDDYQVVFSTNYTTGVEIYVANQAGVKVGINVWVANTDNMFTGFSPDLNAWHHVAVMRSGSSLRVFVDGNQLGSSQTNTSNIQPSTGARIGCRVDTVANEFSGYITEIRVSKGVVRWTSNFTPQTVPYEADGYTKLLLHFEGDRSGRDNVIGFYNIMSIYPSTGENRNYFFEGVNDTILVPYSADWSFGTGDFTISFWANVTDHAHYSSPLSVQHSADVLGWCIIYYHDTDSFHIQCAALAGGSYSGAVDVIHGVWTHYAWTRKSGVVYAFRNGKLVTTDTGRTGNMDNVNNYGLHLGRYYPNYDGYYFEGYLEQLEISKGIARWDSDFTPPPLSIPNEKKIAVTTEDGTTQCPVEIEKWDAENEQAWLWTKAPVIYADRDTDFYLYYDKNQVDNSNVGDTGSTAATNVWSNSYESVWHLTQDGVAASSSLDSVSVARHGSPSGMDVSNIVDGAVAKALSFDESNDYVDVPSINRKATFCISALIFPDGVSSTRQYIYTQQKDPPDICTYTYMERQGIHLSLGSLDGQYYYQNTTPFAKSIKSSDSGHYILAGEWSYVALTGDASGARLYINGELVGSSTVPPAAVTVDDGKIGARLDPNGNDYFGGIIDEVRDYNTACSTEWIKADYHSNFNTLLTFDAFATRPIFLFNGTVKVGETPAARVVNLHRRATGELMGTTVSHSQTGYFEIGSNYNELHYVIILPEAGDEFNLLAYDKLDPEI
ncbi:hypothetical protein DRQ25_09545 [Candidatus Fermentibacteria bacterium]|nr:MAG: hypothetical protein DRQ25_09545 [Candidatus Fermentibacteria bacterium]